MVKLTESDYFGLTDIGARRKVNEDHFMIALLRKSLVLPMGTLGDAEREGLPLALEAQMYVVADGLGGDGQGEQPGRTATETILQYVHNSMPWFTGSDLRHESELLDELKRSVARAQQALQVKSGSSLGERPLGATLTMACVTWPNLYVVHAGDTRCYLIRGSRMEQVTKDHTIAQSMVEVGTIRESEKRGSRWSRMLYNVVGGADDRLYTEVSKAVLEPGDLLLLCTDGLTTHLNDDQILEVVRGRKDPEGACRRLVLEANKAGGSDNITVVLARYGDRHEDGHV